MGIKTVPQPPYSRDLAPGDFWLFHKLRGCRYETIEEMKEAVTKVIDTLKREDFHEGLPEDVGTVLQVNWSRRRLLHRGLVFHACTINKSAHTKKVWKLISCTSYIYIYIYIWLSVTVIFIGNGISHTILFAFFFLPFWMHESIFYLQLWLNRKVYWFFNLG